MRLCQVFLIVALIATLPIFTSVANATIITVEPDNFAEGTVLNTVDPNVTLFTSVNASDLTGNFGFNVLATTVPSGLASTGTKVFSQSGVPFFNSGRNFRMTFTQTASFVGLDFISSSRNEGPVFRIFNSSQQLLGELLLPGAGNGVVQSLSFTRPQLDIKYAVASGSGPFIRLDNLRFDVSSNTVPEPNSALIWSLGLILIGRIRGRRISHRC